MKVGIVAFAGSAQVVQNPTLNREDLVAAIDRFQMQRGTAIGNGIVMSLATIFPEAGIDLNAMMGARQRPQGVAIDQANPAKAERICASGPGLLQLGSDYFADRRATHHRRRFARGCQTRSRPGRTGLYRGHWHSQR